jgi:HAD superfamily hydrolase (TIGR01490 family)
MRVNNNEIHHSTAAEQRNQKVLNRPIRCRAEGGAFAIRLAQDAGLESTVARTGTIYPGEMAGPSRSAAFFDLDKTIIARSSTFAFSRPFYAGGLITRSAVLRSAYAHFVYLAGGADHDQMERMRAYLSDLVTGWDIQQVRDIVTETLEELIQPVVYHEATALIAEHHAAGREVVIVSSSGAEVVEPIGEMLGADRVIATRMIVTDGRYTGEIAFYAYGENKATAIHQLAAELSYGLAECYAYSDSFTDLPMLSAVGHPTAVNPDRALRREAVAREWPVLDFSHPVSLRTRMAEQVQRVPAPAPPVMAVALGASAATLGLVWYATRRRDRTA